MTHSSNLNANTILRILVQVEPEADQLPDQFLQLICQESADGKEVTIVEDSFGDSFITWDQVKHIADVAGLIATCLTIAKTTLDIAAIKKKLPPALAKHPAVDKIISIVVLQ